MSIHATCFGHTDHPQALKTHDFKTQKFKIHTHFISSFKIMCLNVCGWSVRPKHVACSEKMNKFFMVYESTFVNFNTKRHVHYNRLPH